MPNKRRRRRYMKIDLMETSAVGAPSYSFAHFSQEGFSLIKALKAFSEAERRQIETKMPEETEQAKEEAEEQPEAEAEVETKEANVEEETEEVEEEVEAEEEAEETESDTEKSLKEVVTALKDAVETLSVQRGLVEKRETVESKVKSASAGELFLAMLK